jgi:hypothetical protein
MVKLPNVRRCALYTPGHTVNFIQARLAWENPQDDVRAELLGARDGVISVVTEPGEVKRFRNHDIDRLLQAAAGLGSFVVLRAHGVLAMPHDGGTYCFCVKPDDGTPLDRCVDPDDIPGLPADPSPDQIARYLTERVFNEGGGIVIRRP